MTVCFRATAWAFAKLGNRIDELEDAHALIGARRVASKGARYAVADGATMSSFSKEWAHLLVDDFIRKPILAPIVLGRLDSLQAQWLAAFRDRRLPWYAEQKAQKGAFSTLLGLSLHRAHPARAASQGNWTALAVGDTCLFQVRDDGLIVRFPLGVSAEFGDRPLLLSSRRESNALVAAAIGTVKGEWRPNDLFYLMTDALAEWFLRSWEVGERPWQKVESVVAEPADTGDTFNRWVDEGRSTGAIRNDDVTLLRVAVVDDGNTPSPAG